MRALNHFERKSILYSLRKFNVLNMVLNFDRFKNIYYTIFFERGGFIFSFNINLSHYAKNNFIDDFFENTQKRIGYFISDIDEHILNEKIIGNGKIFIVSDFIFRTLISEKENYVKAGIIIDKGPDLVGSKIEKKARQMLINGLSPVAIMDYFFKEIGIDKERFKNKIINAKDLKPFKVQYD